MDLRAVDDAMRFLCAQTLQQPSAPSPGGASVRAVPSRGRSTDRAVRAVLDPFCGVGSVLAGANAYCLAALGVDHSPRRCREARAMQLTRAQLRRERQRHQYHTGLRKQQ